MSRHPNFVFGKPHLKDMPVTVADHATYAIFGKAKADMKKSSRFVMVGDDDTRIPTTRGGTSLDKGYAIAERLRTSYELFVDDTAVPNRDEFRHIGTCVVARTNEAAIDAVKKLGMPKTLYVDYHLRREVAVEFVQWLVQWAAVHEIQLSPSFTYHIHGCLIADEELRLRQFLDGMIRDRTT